MSLATTKTPPDVMTPGVNDFKFLTAPVEVFGDGQNFILKGTSVKLLWKIGWRVGRSA
ncbi:MAG: hypothetical protein ACFB0G_18525 [Leptolyngbyaceae cyanobacterium]